MTLMMISMMKDELLSGWSMRRCSGYVDDLMWDGWKRERAEESGNK